MKDSDWEILYELHKNPNMTKVSNLLYITQPSLTKRLQYMESLFQITIVNRTSKGLKFTKEGEYLADRAEKYIKFINETKKEIKKFKKKSEDVITIGSSYTYSKYKLTDVLVNYKKKYPNDNVKFEIVNDQSNILFRKVIEESIDVGFIRGDYQGSVKKVLIGVNQGYLVTKKPVDIKEIVNIPKIDYKTNDKTIEILDNWWKDWFNTKVPMGTNVGFIDFAWQLIDKDLGYTCCFLPDNFINDYNLYLKPLIKNDGSKITRNTWFVYPKSKELSRGLKTFIEYIKNELAIK